MEGKNYYEIGALVRGSFRSLLWQLQFKYGSLSWTEDKGWIESTFYVKGDTEAIQELNRIVESWG